VVRPEPLSERAERLLDGDQDLLAPDLIFPELGNVLWKKVARRELSPAEGREVLSALDRVPLVVAPSRPLAAAALEIALAHGRTVYDAIYVALAVASDCALVTATSAWSGRWRKAAGPARQEPGRAVAHRASRGGTLLRWR